MAGIRLPDPNRLEHNDAVKMFLQDLVRALQYSLDGTEEQLGINDQTENLDDNVLTSTGNIPRDAGVILVDTSAATVSVALPDPLDARGEVYYVKKISTLNTVVLTCITSGVTIDKETSITLVGIDYPTVKVYSDGSEYWII